MPHSTPALCRSASALLRLPQESWMIDDLAIYLKMAQIWSPEEPNSDRLGLSAWPTQVSRPYRLELAKPDQLAPYGQVHLDDLKPQTRLKSQPEGHLRWKNQNSSCGSEPQRVSCHTQGFPSDRLGKIGFSPAQVHPPYSERFFDLYPQALVLLPAI
ncbi:hypothetical protein MHYP_G00316650 [Metynnis hypsauchen]